MKTTKSSFFKSLRFRIILILVLIGILPGILVLRVVISVYEGNAIEVRTQNMRRECESLASMLIKQDFFENPQDNTIEGKLELSSNLFHGRIMISDRDFRVVYDSYGAEEGNLLLSPLAIRCFRGEEPARYDRKEHTLTLAVPIDSPLVEEAQGVILLTSQIGEVSDTIREMEQREMLMTGIIVASIFMLALFLSGVLVKPFGRLTKAIEDLTDGYLDEEISVPDYTETVLITSAFNKLLSRMKVVDEPRNEFVSNVSHELKTPMTSMKILADSLVGQSGVSEDLYQEFLSDITKEIDRENKIISDLLSLVKLDKKTADMVITHISINSLMERILKRLRPIADLRSISLILESYREVTADVDETKLTSAIVNLVENAIKYNVDDGWVRVTVDADHQFAFITVADSGMGIPKDSIERIFERFYRVDKSHSREIGGTGLGLAISRSAIAAHKGTITVESTEGVGTTFRVRIPLTYIAP